MPARSEHEHVREDLPGEQGLGDEGQPDVGPLPVDVAPPGSHLPILQDHVHGEDVEEQEDREVDGVDESRRAASLASGSPAARGTASLVSERERTGPRMGTSEGGDDLGLAIGEDGNSLCALSSRSGGEKEQSGEEAHRSWDSEGEGKGCRGR